MGKQIITRKDIAQMAGTSVSVVSRVLNNSGYVAKEKRERILELAEQLNYKPNPVAISLQQQKTKQILFYCKELGNSYNIQLYRGMLQTAADRGYMVLLNGRMSFADIKNTLVDGIIMPNPATAKSCLETEGKNYHLPMVSASYGDLVHQPQSLPVVDVDMFQITEKALGYLEEKGHRKIAMCAPFSLEDISARILVYRRWMREKSNLNKDYFMGIEKREAKSGAFPEDDYEYGRQAAHDFVKRKLDATAVLGFNDECSLGLIRGFQEQGIHVPEDVSVMGIDGIEGRRYVTPLLTTISLKPEIQGAKCMEVLLNMIEGQKYKYVTHTGFQLLEGESVKNLKNGR